MSIDLPDSALCRASEEHARTLSPPFLFNHAMRSFVFANAASPGFTFNVCFSRAVKSTTGSGFEPRLSR